jgi:hypothetical protein
LGVFGAQKKGENGHRAPAARAAKLLTTVVKRIVNASRTARIINLSGQAADLRGPNAIAITERAIWIGFTGRCIPETFRVDF